MFLISWFLFVWYICFCYFSSWINYTSHKTTENNASYWMWAWPQRFRIFYSWCGCLFSYSFLDCSCRFFSPWPILISDIFSPMIISSCPGYVYHSTSNLNTCYNSPESASSPLLSASIWPHFNLSVRLYTFFSAHRIAYMLNSHYAIISTRPTSIWKVQLWLILLNQNESLAKQYCCDLLCILQNYSNNSLLVTIQLFNISVQIQQLR
jgi:hypothetical protein